MLDCLAWLAGTSICNIITLTQVGKKDNVCGRSIIFKAFEMVQLNKFILFSFIHVLDI